MDWDGLNDLGDGREERDEVVMGVGIRKSKRCFESERIVWNCSTRRWLGAERSAEGCPEETTVYN